MKRKNLKTRKTRNTSKNPTLLGAVPSKGNKLAISGGIDSRIKRTSNLFQAGLRYSFHPKCRLLTPSSSTNKIVMRSSIKVSALWVSGSMALLGKPCKNITMALMKINANIILSFKKIRFSTFIVEMRLLGLCLNNTWVKFFNRGIIGRFNAS